jgi:hypothetical protein
MVASALSSVIIRCDSAVESRGNTVKSDDTLSSYLVSKRLRIGKWGAAISVLIGFAVVSSASYGLWFVYYRPYTPDEVLLHEHWRAGDVRGIEGTITNITYFNTTRGREVYLGLKGDWSSMCKGFVRGDPNRSYAIGERYKTTLHFVRYNINDAQGVWAEELLCPTTAILLSIGVVMDAVSYVSGFTLFPLGQNETGWSRYEVITRDGDQYPLSLVNASLRKGFYGFPSDLPLIDSAAKWIILAAVEYVQISGGYSRAPIVDEMDSLADTTSRNGTIFYADLNGNKLLDDGDQFRLQPREDQVGAGYQTYLLSLGGGWWCGYTCGLKYVLNGAHGPYEPIVSGQAGWLNLHHVNDQIGQNVTSTIEVLQRGQVVVEPISEFNFTLDVNGRSGTIMGNLAALPMTTADGITIAYHDLDGDGRVNGGDRISIGGIANRTALSLRLVMIGDGGMAIRWIAGYGHIVGNIPNARFTTNERHAPLRINVTVPWWHQELNLSKHLNVSLWENSTLVVDSVALTNGSVSSFPGGNLTFRDGDADGFLSSGDYFVLNGNPHARYKIGISVLWGYATFSQEFDPS